MMTCESELESLSTHTWKSPSMTVDCFTRPMNSKPLSSIIVSFSTRRTKKSAAATACSVRKRLLQQGKSILDVPGADWRRGYVPPVASTPWLRTELCTTERGPAERVGQVSASTYL